MGDRIIANVYETRNYDMFKKLLGNRDVTEIRISKITDSIVKVGYVLNPVVINEKNEVIDGQGRIEALKRLDMPVHYVIDKGAGLEQCVQLNINGTKWTTVDFIESYVHQGNRNYINLKELMDEFPGFTSKVITYAVNERINHSSTAHNKLVKRNYVINGQFECSDEQKQTARSRLKYLVPFLPIAKAVNGNSDTFLIAIMFSAFNCDVKKDRMYKKVFELQQEIIPFTTMRNALKSISTVYNHSLKGKKIDLEYEYVRYCELKAPSYKSRWNKEAI